MPALLDRFTGCLLGGAVGDALGAPVEFSTLAEIRARFGPVGIRDFAEAYGRVGAITDDTQMTLFTAEGLIRADNRHRDRGICHVPGVVHRAYLRWLSTQGVTPPLDPDFDDVTRGGWLVHVPGLHARRAPGATCLEALRGGEPGAIERPTNDSKGCGGVMRIAPAGFTGPGSFRLGCELAAITHGHPSGYLAAGVVARVVEHVAGGGELADGVEAVDRAVALAGEGSPGPEAVESLGAGWVAEEALAIALYSALSARDFEQGVVLAANHSGDSDSTAAITGNLLGTLHGVEAIPPRWLEQLELRREIETLAHDLAAHFGRRERTSDYDRYPPW
jgi:ADP-ribosylglycohydrolase